MDPVGVLQAVGALWKARDGDVFVLLHPSVVGALLRVRPADAITFNDLDVHTHHCALVKLLPPEAEEAQSVSWQRFWNALSCSHTERVGRLCGEVTATGDFYRDRQWHSTGMYTGSHGSRRSGQGTGHAAARPARHRPPTRVLPGARLPLRRRGAGRGRAASATHRRRASRAGPSSRPAAVGRAATRTTRAGRLWLRATSRSPAC